MVVVFANEDVVEARILVRAVARTSHGELDGLASSTRISARVARARDLTVLVALVLIHAARSAGITQLRFELIQAAARVHRDFCRANGHAFWRARPGALPFASATLTEARAHRVALATVERDRCAAALNFIFTCAAIRIRAARAAGGAGLVF